MFLLRKFCTYSNGGGERSRKGYRCSGVCKSYGFIIIPLISMLLYSFSANVSAQNLTLFDCLDKAEQNFPLLKGKEVLLSSSDLNIQNLKNKWLPRMEATGQSSWQSDVPSVNMDVQVPGFSVPQAPKDQYKVAIDVSQILYDGGKTRKRIDVEQIAGNIETQSIEVQMLDVSKRVAELFFSILMLEEQKQQISHKLKVLESRISELDALLANGAVSESATKKLEAEYFEVQQQLISVETSEETLLANLASFLGELVKSASGLIKPSAGELLIPEPRPEYSLFALQKKRLEQMTELQQRNRWPVLAAFGQGGYGNPGYNMLKDEFDTFYMMGLRLKWTPWDWNETKRAKKVMENQMRLVDIEEETFRVNQYRAVNQLDGELSRFQQLIELDRKIVELRQGIEENSALLLKNGSITTSEYLDDLDLHISALINKDLHQLGYLQGMTMKFLSGDKQTIE
ncbi:TolC family protein [Marinilabilia sp.]|uniref:TolC family protein n=1 Tax=Marinilabilia sp. TaxID=2021252 RepID=UPI0025B9D5BC|nr:TolC family protein [Marinilabilia sp.]